MSDADRPALQVHRLTKRYGSIEAVSDLSFHVAPGRVTGFLGANGAGKSTTLRMILGLDKPTSGAATINGLRFAELANPMRIVGALLDAGAVHPRRCAQDHLWAIARAGEMPRSRVEETLELVGLSAAARRPAGDYSLGMKQRLGIATALIGEPDIVILDEPLNGLDPEGIRWARSLMRALAEAGRTVLFSSHLMGEMELTADHLIVIDRGRLVADEPLSEFIRSRTTEHVFVRAPERDRLRDALVDAGLEVGSSGSDGLNVAATTTDLVGRIAASNGVELAELSRTRDSLEELFLRMTASATPNQE